MAKKSTGGFEGAIEGLGRKRDEKNYQRR